MHHHNRELLATIERLKMIIVQLEAENQLLKEVQSPDVIETPRWLMEGANFIPDLPEEVLGSTELG